MKSLKDDSNTTSHTYSSNLWPVPGGRYCGHTVPNAYWYNYDRAEARELFWGVFENVPMCSDKWLFGDKPEIFCWQTGNILVTFKQGPSNAMSVCCDKDYFAFCEDASGNKLENCQDNLSGIAKRTANGAIDDSKSHLNLPLHSYNS